MAWPNLFRRENENTRHAWGYTFQWTSGHFTSEQLHPLKYSYDSLASECLDRLDEISPPHTTQLPRNRDRLAPNGEQKATPERDLYCLLRDHSGDDEKLGQLWNEVNSIPDWVEWDQIARGQDVFYRYGGAALTAVGATATSMDIYDKRLWELSLSAMYNVTGYTSASLQDGLVADSYQLAYQSLLGGMGASRVVETLARTGGFGVKVARHRMYETTQHILQVTQSLESIKPGGAGHASSIRVRLLHAAVRRRILKLSQARPEYFDVKKLGVPINDLDSIATIGTFSATLIWLGFPRQGIWLRKQEIEDFLAMWRLVAYYVGTPTEYFATVEKAKCIMESILLSEIAPTETSKILANNIISSLQGQPPTYASRDFLNASARWLNGNELADALGLGQPGLYYWALVAGQCIFFCCICYTYRSIPFLDQRKVKALRKIFYNLIVENHAHGLGTETRFVFKYIPDFHTSTEQGAVKETGLIELGVERRNLRTLAIALTITCITMWYGAKIVSRGLKLFIK